MRIIVNEQASLKEAEVTITVPRLDDTALALQRYISAFDAHSEETGVAEPNPNLQRIVGYGAQGARLLPCEGIALFYAQHKNVYALTADEQPQSWQIRKSLKDLQMLLDQTKFVRINHSEIVNLEHVRGLDFSATGTIGLQLNSGKYCYVSRRQLKEVRQALEQ